jgi:limonene-1,2-epoxide hydrolase
MTPIETVTSFLAAMEARDLARAQSFLGAGFAMVFPGDRRFTRLEDLVASSGKRYRWVKKTHERFDVLASGADTIVYVFGTLYGEWLDGAKLEGIRYIDRFVLCNGKLVDQRVWNDLAEAQAAGAMPASPGVAAAAVA